MKKAKLALAAIAVLAVVGGVYASKAKRNAIIYCTQVPNNRATQTVFDKTLTIAPFGAPATCTAVYNAIAPATRTTVLE